MVSEIEELYKLEKKDIKSACLVLGKAFHEDPAWVYVIPDESERSERLPIIFEFVIRYSLRYGEVYAPTRKLEGIATWVPHTTVEKTTWRIFRSGAVRAALKMGREIARKIESLFDQLDKDRREHMKDRSYFYLEGVGVAPEFQGQGFGGRLLKAMFARVDIEHIPIYLETVTEANVQIYSKYGFNILKEWDPPGAGFHVWEMLREPKET